MERRPVDWLMWTERALALAAVLLVAGGLVGAAAPFAGQGFTVQVPVSALAEVTAASPAGLADGAVLDPAGTVGVEIAEPTSAQAAALALGWVPTMTAAGIAVILLLRIVHDARRVGPFTPATVRRLRAIAVVSLVGGPVAIAATAISNGLLTDSVLRGASHPEVHVTFEWALLGLGFLALAEVVRTGQAMRHELDEVI